MQGARQEGHRACDTLAQGGADRWQGPRVLSIISVQTSRIAVGGRGTRHSKGDILGIFKHNQASKQGHGGQ